MTFSIVARCPRTGQFGVAAATAMPAVGKLLSHAVAGAGALATQARRSTPIWVWMDWRYCVRDCRLRKSWSASKPPIRAWNCVSAR